MSPHRARTRPATPATPSLLARARRGYGAPLWQLLLVLAAFVVIVYLVVTAGISTFWNPEVWWQSILVWFLAAVIVHDLVLFPLYAAADRGLGAVLRRVPRPRERSGGAGAVSVLNYLRLPVLATGLVTVLFLPGIIEQGKTGYLRATGQTQEPFDDRWLVLCAAFFVVAALAYAVRVLTTRRRRAGRVSARPR